MAHQQRSGRPCADFEQWENINQRLFSEFTCLFFEMSPFFLSLQKITQSAVTQCETEVHPVHDSLGTLDFCQSKRFDAFVNGPCFFWSAYVIFHAFTLGGVFANQAR